jgi:cell division septation protein DedD
VVRQSLRNQYSPKLENGLRMLEAAIQIDPNYSDSMAYLNLINRLKAGMAETPVESANLMLQADAWVQKAIAAKRQPSHATGSAPSRLDVDAPPPGPANAQATVATPPPPPPPPPPPSSALANQPASSLAPVPRSAAEGVLPGSYWQIAPPSRMSAVDLVHRLNAKGFQSMMFVSKNDNQVRVMAGPYGDATSLDQAKVQLEAAGFVALRKW